MMPTVVIVGTLDTKGPEHAFIRDLVREHGCETILVDAGVMSTSPLADISADEVAAAAGHDRATLAGALDRGEAVTAMAAGAAVVVRRLHDEGRLDGIVGLGGTGGTTIASVAMAVLPLGVPKLIVSTVAAGDTRPYVGTSDIAMIPSVVDIAGINRVSEAILANAAAAIAGMARARSTFASRLPARPVLAATMYGVTTPCVTAARRWLEERGYEVLVFHATGVGGRAMEALIRSGGVAGVLDVTTAELVDELLGGVMSAGPDRLEAAGAAGIPQVVSVGAIDTCVFGPPDSLPTSFAGRSLHAHNATVTLMRTSPAECREVGRIMARKLNAARGPVSVFLPLRGISMLDAPGMPFHDPEADGALFEALREGLRPGIELAERDLAVNDPAFAEAMAARLDALVSAAGGTPRPGQPPGGPSSPEG